jgi:hypothetical protein
MSIKIDKNKMDYYPNAPMFAPNKFEISKYFMDKISSQNVKDSLNEFVMKVNDYITKNCGSLPVQYKIALNQHIEDLAYFISNVIGNAQNLEGSRSLTEIERVYVSDIFSRITKRVLNITNDKKKVKEILNPLELFTDFFFKENVEKMVNDISNDKYETEVDRIMAKWAKS